MDKYRRFKIFLENTQDFQTIDRLYQSRPNELAMIAIGGLGGYHGMLSSQKIFMYLFHKYKSSCSRFRGDKLQFNKCLVTMYNKYIQSLIKLRAKCNQSKNPEKCVKNLNKKIDFAKSLMVRSKVEVQKLTQK